MVAEPAGAARGASAPTIQAVIPATRAPTVGTVVRQLAEHDLAGGAIVVDDTPDGRVTAALGDLAVRVLRSRAAGSGGARNAGVAAATATWVLLVDDDVTLPAGFGVTVRRLVEAASADVAVVGSTVVPVGDVSRPYWRCRLVETPPPGGFMTACLLVRREAYLAVGGCRRTRTPFRDDTDLWLRIVERGYRGVVTGELSVLHPVERMSLSRCLRSALLYREDGWFNRRHPGHLAGSGRKLVLGPVTLRHFRSRLPLVGLAATLPLVLLAGSPWAAAAGPLATGVALNLVHLRALRRAGFRVPSAAALDPVEIAVHAAWGVAAALARLAGEVDCLRGAYAPEP